MRSSFVRRRIAAAVGVLGSLAGVVFAASSARAAEDFASPRRLPAPFVLPELSHPTLDARVDWLVGRVSPVASHRSASAASLLVPSVETSAIAFHRVSFGFTLPIAAALPPDGALAPAEASIPSGTRVLLGNAEAHVRAVFPLPSSLEIGFTLGLVAPTAPFDESSRANRSVAEAAASLDPTSYVLFRPGRFALRPAGDLRIVSGTFVFQGRHGVDVALDGALRAKIAGRLLGHVGLLLRPDLEVSIEATQLYVFSSDEKATGELTPAEAFANVYRISDDHRTALTIGPGVRLSSRDVDLGAALVTNLSSPLSPAAGGFVGLNLSVVGHVGAPRR